MTRETGPETGPAPELLQSLPSVDGVSFVSLEQAERRGLLAASRLPLTLKILAECALRCGGSLDALTPASAGPRKGTLEFSPTRLLLQDFTGLPLMTDLASLRDVVAERGGDAAKVNPRIPVDFVCDHALIAEHGGRADARRLNERIEIERNRERFEFLKWCAGAFDNIRLIPPGSGIMHQLNLEWLSSVVRLLPGERGQIAVPDTLLGTDSHTTMVNGLGVLAWGVGGIEAQSAMLGHPTLVTAPRVAGLRLTGELQAGVTSTDLVLAVTHKLRAAGVVGDFVEVLGDAVARLSVETRATVANMAPEYGATSVMFPIDAETLRYLRLTAREKALIARVEAYAKAQGLWRDASDHGDATLYDDVIDLDLCAVLPAMAGPTKPDQLTALANVPQSFAAQFGASRADAKPARAGKTKPLADGDVVLAAITSCTNTSNPSAMLAAGLLARNAVEKGLAPQPWVKTTFAPGSQVVADYLGAAGLTGPLDALGFQIIGFGCTTCNGNSGPLKAGLEAEIEAGDIAAVAVLSGNRNFEGRIHARVRAGYLASPALVIAYAIAGTIKTDLTTEPLGHDGQGRPVMLADIWPSDKDIATLLPHVQTASYARTYAGGTKGHDGWAEVVAPSGPRFAWRSDSTFVSRSPFDGRPQMMPDAITGMRPLAILGDAITTDHLSPNGEILPGTAGARWLAARGVQPADFGTYAARRGHHEIGIRSGLANAHVRNLMVPGERGSVTLLMPEKTRVSIFDAAETYLARGTPAIIIAGRGYGSGSSRDWAAKAVRYLGVRAVVAESFERIHRSNLIGVGVLPLALPKGITTKSLALDGSETFSVSGIGAALRARGRPLLRIDRTDGRKDAIEVRLEVHTAREADVLAAGGLFPVLIAELTKAG